MAKAPTFLITLRGYDRGQVDALLARIQTALNSADPAVRSQVLAELDQVSLKRVMRGYDSQEVDAHLEQARIALQQPDRQQ